MFLIVNLMFVIAAGLMVLVVAATASQPRSGADREPAGRMARPRRQVASE